jgi:hypothetical protein
MFSKTRAHVALAKRNALRLSGTTGPTRVKTGYYTRRNGVDYAIFRDLKHGGIYRLIKPDPISPEFLNCDDTVVANREILHEGSRVPALYLVMPGGTYKRDPMTATKTAFFIVVDGKRVHVE